MQVGFYVRTDQSTKPGGDLVQAKAYMAALVRRGCVVRLIDHEDQMTGLEVLHVFNLDRPWDCLPLARRARARGCTVVLSSIAHPRASVRRYQAERSFRWERLLARVGLGGFSERLKAVARGATTRNRAVIVVAARHGIKGAARELWALASGVQLLSAAEREELARQGFSCTGKAAVVVRNGVDPAPAAGEFRDAALASFIRQHARFAVSGGRIEPRKNPLAVLRAAADLSIPLVFAGHLNERHRGYCREFLRAVAACPTAYYAGGVAREEFGRLLRAAHVHVSASLFEVSPLVDLEARALGCTVVATRESLGTEFLDAHAELCDPWSDDSIRAALERVWAQTERAPAMSVPSWDAAGEPLLELYRAARGLTHERN